jgi:hypothetical protein
MKYLFTALVAVGAGMLLAAPATADWKEGDPYKMHYPQLPDPNGWDIDMTNYVLADDWKCTETGMVDDIHFWFSVEKQTSPDPAQVFLGPIRVSIHADVPIGSGNDFGFSYPGKVLRQWTFDASQYQIAGPFPGLQGWDDPNPNSDCIYQDHNWYWQVNITKIGEIVPNPFQQREGTIYWLDLQVPQPDTAGLVGWKTTRGVFNDAAVYASPLGPGWQPVAVCSDNMPTDFAFVITPEPGTVAMLIGAGLVGLVAVARRRRK